MLNYTIVGDGRLARHFSHYFKLLGVPHSGWARNPDSSFNTFTDADAERRLLTALKGSDRVLLLVSDQAIETVLKQFPFLYEKTLIHCSGSLTIDAVAGVHPLMTFSEERYEASVYQSIPFVLETGHCFEELFPDLPNPHVSIAPGDKVLYHAMCVMAGNFAQLMWKQILDRFENVFDWPQDLLAPYLKQVVDNFIQSPQTALTGPLVRNDQQTIKANMDALEGDPLKEIYTAFLQFHQNGKTIGLTDERQLLGEVS